MENIDKLQKLTVDNAFLLSCPFQEISEEEKAIIIDGIVEFSFGRKSFYSLENVINKTLKFLSRQNENKVKGFIAELLMLTSLRQLGFKQEYCLLNLEENSMKKGFDGVFSLNNHMWIAESKSTSIRVNHDYTLQLAYKGLNDMVSGNTSNDPWKNAISHAQVVGSGISLLKKLTKLSESYDSNSFPEIKELNIVISSTLINENCDEENDSPEIISKIIEKYSFKQALVVLRSMESHQDVISILEDSING